METEETENNDTGDYEITGLTFKRVMPGRKIIKGTADQYPYTLEDRVINGETVKVKVYLPASVIYNTDSEVREAEDGAVKPTAKE